MGVLFLMLIKVCGLTDSDNITAVASLRPAMLGFILYPPSPRGISEEKLRSTLTKATIPNEVRKIGVFVNECVERIEEIVMRCSLDGVQLHGDEDVEFCTRLRSVLPGITIIKAIAVGDGVNARDAMIFDSYVDFLLFDTQTAGRGGSGKSFEWENLFQYTGSTPTILSGGLGPSTIARAINFRKEFAFAGVDLNSQIESSPGKKDMTLLQQVLKEVR